MEEWKPIQDFDGMFSVSNTGLIRNNKTGKVLRQTVNKRGYLCVAVKPNGREGKGKCFRTHREVAIAFVPNPDNLKEVNHKDGIKLNNDHTNLEWSTRSDNMLHADKHNLLNIHRGEKNVESKLTEPQVKEILNNQNISDTEFAAKFGVHKKTVWAVRKRKSWKHVAA